MLQQDVFHQQEELRIDDISSPMSARIFDFCDPELFSETLKNSEVTSSSNCYYQENSSYTNNTSLPTDADKFNHGYQDNTNANTNTTTPATTATSTTTTATTNNSNNNNNSCNNLSIIFDSQDEIDNDISASIDFSPSPHFSVNPFLSTQQYQFDFSSVQPHQIPISDVNVDGLSSQYHVEAVALSLLGPHHQPLPSVFEEDCLSSVPSYVPLNPSSPSCSFLGPAAMTTYMPTGTMSAALSTDSGGIFTGGILRGSDWQLQELDYQGDNGGIYCPDSLQRVFNPGDLQALSGDSQQLVGGASSSTPIASEISSLEDSTFKVGKLSVEQRKEKIHRYLKKRNERNFSKKIKYACRKTLADSRPRVRGRFAKNDDFGETLRTTCSNHEEDDEDEVVAIKEEDDVNDLSTDILGHITGVNSFKYNNYPNNYSIQSWI
ncbi:bromodomain and WD repeat-containing DDB_G0285837-like isoform X2 [Mangifera indica]|uniref:bromodomain and WD repeat-containing DDB_G0285837-like isoform X2 n=1 Tax=Mangifera indica TaxID=29780 RepID=UPI001CFAAB77|nr:bromodomain and WD repeat-containing DDB_G0285837-like isoform X2 [Mangifera indica]